MSNDALIGEVEFSDDDILRYTQGIRKRFIDEQIQNGFSDDIKAQTILLTALADADRTALSNKKIGASEKVAASDRMVALAIARLRGQLGEVDPFEINEDGKVPTIDLNELPPTNAVPGETDIGISNENYAQLIAKFD